ncbi:MAG: phage integrase N-terminal SAM-like domain-containing protein [Acidobacteriaceae bacterium]|nr:phage integrase N-terminal SAM-like domain-containing protein [Acidobacteriaceae bacterium]
MEPVLLTGLIRRYLDQTDTLKKRNTYRKYNVVLTRFEKHFTGRRLEQISIEELDDFIVKLKKSGLSANTVLHNVIIIAQFFRRERPARHYARTAIARSYSLAPADVLRRGAVKISYGL